MLGVISDMQKCGITKLNITGGEPFLYLDTLLKLIEKARKCDVVAITFNTNAFWAKDLKNAHKILDKLSDAGFRRDPDKQSDMIKASSGIYHQEEGISLETISNLIKAFYDKFHTSLRINYELNENSDQARQKIIDSIYANGVGREKFKIFFRQVVAIGRAERLADKCPFWSASEIGPCNSLNQIVFDPDGTCRPCCGLNTQNKGIIIGNIKSNKLSEILKMANNNPILQFISQEPMGQLLSLLNQKERERGYSGPCDLCNNTLGDISNDDLSNLKQQLASDIGYYPHWFVDYMN
jgi:MoaA/NifB/PqqE/SkfB family radical SAM enzyme